MAAILIVDDDPTVIDVVRRYLIQAGHTVDCAVEGREAIAKFTHRQPDLVILDLMIPLMSGWDVCREMRLVADTPIIMLTARDQEADRVQGLELGADDYVSKPFSPRELTLRVSSILRRTAAVESPPIRVLNDGDIVLDIQQRAAIRAGRDLALTVREFDLLRHFLEHPNTAFSRLELLQQVWGWSIGDDSTVTVHVRRLREKIEIHASDPQRIQTVWGVGYRYAPRVDHVE
ncbi:MAG: response regulator transcription factor [Antricoccus sp.]